MFEVWVQDVGVEEPEALLVFKPLENISLVVVFQYRGAINTAK